MGNCQSSGLKELFEEVISNEHKQPDSGQRTDCTPDRMTLIDPRSPLIDAERTPIEVLFKTAALAREAEKTDEVTTDDSHHHKRQLDDPRSATAFILRTPIFVESPLQVDSDNTEADAEDVADVEDGLDDGRQLPPPTTAETPVLVPDLSHKVIAVAKKLTFDVSLTPRRVKTAEVTAPAPSRAPLAHVQANTANGPRVDRQGRRLSAKAKPQGPMSPLQMLHVRQRLAVKRALQLTRAQVENCPPTGVEDGHTDPPVQPVKVSASPALAAKDPTLRF